ncbi:MAG: spore maturation protein [bacterium]|jgi:spore maturation protein B
MLLRMVSAAGVWFVPLLLLAVFLAGVGKRVPLYETFIEGAGEGFPVAVRLLPNLIGIFLAIYLFRASGALEMLLGPLQPWLARTGVPTEVVPLMVVRPLSGSAALGLTSEIITRYGPDSFIGRLACTLNGSSDTTFYIIAVYYAAVGVKDPRYSLPVGLLANLAGFAAAVYICRVVFL